MAQSTSVGVGKILDATNKKAVSIELHEWYGVTLLVVAINNVERRSEKWETKVCISIAKQIKSMRQRCAGGRVREKANVKRKDGKQLLSQRQQELTIPTQEFKR